MKWVAVIVGTALACLNNDPRFSEYVLLLAKARLHPVAFARDPLIHAATHSLYTLAPYLLSFLVSSVNGIVLLNLTAWALLSFLMYKLASRFLNPLGALVAVCLYAQPWQPLFTFDGPLGMDKLERSLGMIPLLYALGEVGKDDALAWLFTIIAIYAHASPAVYYLPLVLVCAKYQYPHGLVKCLGLTFVSLLPLALLSRSTLPFYSVVFTSGALHPLYFAFLLGVAWFIGNYWRYSTSLLVSLFLLAGVGNYFRHQRVIHVLALDKGDDQNRMADWIKNNTKETDTIRIWPSNLLASRVSFDGGALEFMARSERSVLPITPEYVVAPAHYGAEAAKLTRALSHPPSATLFLTRSSKPIHSWIRPIFQTRDLALFDIAIKGL